MLETLAQRLAAARAAAAADHVDRCAWCYAPADAVQLVTSDYEDAGRVVECENESACHARFEILNGISS